MPITSSNFKYVYGYLASLDEDKNSAWLVGDTVCKNKQKS